MKTKPTYTEYEVSKILRDSEGRKVVETEFGEGHAEGLHELQAYGKNRSNVTDDELNVRLIRTISKEKEGKEVKAEFGAFDGCQAKAIAYALNTRSGQTALGWLCFEECKFVFVRIDITPGNFRIVGYDSREISPAPPGGARFFVGPTYVNSSGESSRTAVVLPGLLKRIPGIAHGIAMKLMKTMDKRLHIRTAFPLTTILKQEAEVYWRHSKNQPQILPI